jgi:hypothetical protein
MTCFNNLVAMLFSRRRTINAVLPVQTYICAIRGLRFSDVLDRTANVGRLCMCPPMPKATATLAIFMDTIVFKIIIVEKRVSRKMG